MANWVLIENNEIKEYYDTLPNNWRNVSGLHLSADNLDYLKTLGWYPVNNLPREYDSENYQEAGFEYKFENDQVTCELLVVPISEEERQRRIKEEEDFVLYRLQPYLNSIRVDRNKKLQDSDWTQFQDVSSTKSEEWKENWRVYRQKLRDIPNNFDHKTFQWPEVPN